MAKKSKTQIRLEYFVARAILGFLGLLPRKLAVASGILVARTAYRFLGGLRRVGHRNLEIAFPEKPKAERETLLIKSFENLGRILGEVSQFPRATPESLDKLTEFEIRSDQKLLYEKAKSEGRGAIIVTPHLGNWEMLVFSYSALEAPISYLARPLDNPLIEDLTVKLRTRFGNRPINKTNSVMPAIEVLRRGEILGILADVNAHPKEGVFVPFFGVPACTSTGVAMLALRTNSIIIPICGVWDKVNNRYKIIHGDVIEPSRTDVR
jgi:KDO2-lipid IV(A) lauroyltransferase